MRASTSLLRAGSRSGSEFTNFPDSEITVTRMAHPAVGGRGGGGGVGGVISSSAT